MNRLGSSIVAVVLLGSCSHAVVTSDSAGLPLELSEVSGPYKITINRKASAPRLQTLIRIAEAAPPVLGDQWWFEEFDGTRVASAVTSDALGYYLRKIKQFQETNGLAPRGLRMGVAELDYSARVTPLGRNRYQVDLSLSWLQVCGSLCAMTFDKHRTVVLTSDGEVLEITGDSEEHPIVS